MEAEPGKQIDDSTNEGVRSAFEMRREWEQKMADALVEKGYITRPTLSDFDVEKIDYDKLPQDIKFMIGQFVRYSLSPILEDNIVDNARKDTDSKDTAVLPDKSKRSAIKNELKKLEENGEGVEKDLFKFYESNKLQSSNIGSILPLIEMLHTGSNLSEELFEEYQNIKKDFTGENDKLTMDAIDKYGEFYASSPYMGARYLNVLDNAEKLELVKRFSKLVEDIISEVVNKYNK